MSKKKKYPVLHDGVAKKTASKMTFIEFGDPEPVAAWGCYYGSLWDGYNGWYTPPIERMDLAMANRQRNIRKSKYSAKTFCDIFHFQQTHTLFSFLVPSDNSSVSFPDVPSKMPQ